MAELTKGIPEDVKAPSLPVIKKFWQRHGDSLVYTSQSQQTLYVAEMVKRISAHLAVELNEVLLPVDQAGRRNALLKQANVKSSEVALADSLIKRLEITFDVPTDLNQAFYRKGMRLPQEQIKALTFDIDTGTNTISEMRVETGDGLQLIVEIRHTEVEGGLLPQRFQITSPDGKIDDLYEVKFLSVEDYTLPASMLRIIRRPDFQDTLEVFFKDYQVNQPIPAEIQDRLRQK